MKPADEKTMNPEEEEEKMPFEELPPLTGKNKWDYRKMLLKNLPFYLFLVVLTVFYIANVHQAEKLERNLVKTEKSLKELGLTYKVVKREVVFRSKQSELVKVVAPLGLEVTDQPPIIIKSKK